MMYGQRIYVSLGDKDGDALPAHIREEMEHPNCGLFRSVALYFMELIYADVRNSDDV